jgi:hypothetical protein
MPDDQMNDRERDANYATDKANRYFNCTDRERAVFEAGIKLGSIYHQFVGTPVSKVNVEVLERAITEGVRIQPYVKNVEIKIKQDKLGNKRDEYDYDSLSGDMLKVHLEIQYRNSRAVAHLEYIEDINYPLMYISSIE